MRLHVAERPERRELGEAGDARVLANDVGRVCRGGDEDVQRRGVRNRRQHLPLRSSEIEHWRGRRRSLRLRRRRHDRLMNVHAPAVRADQPLDRHATAVRAQLIASLAVPHPIGGPLAIELRAALAETEQRPFRQEERHIRARCIEGQPLHRLPRRIIHVQRRGVGGEAHGQVSSTNRREGDRGGGPRPCLRRLPPARHLRERVPPATGTTVRRTVIGLTEATAISTGTPLTITGAPWARKTPPENASAVPRLSRFKASRREKSSGIFGTVTDYNLRSLIAGLNRVRCRRRFGIRDSGSVF